MNHALRRVSLACLVMFLLLLVNANYVQGFESNKLADDPGPTTRAGAIELLKPARWRAYGPDNPDDPSPIK